MQGESPSQEPGPGLGRGGSRACSSWLSLFLGGMAPQYPLGRTQLDDCSRSKGRMGRKKREVGKVQDTGLRHRNVNWGFGDSGTGRWGTLTQQVK